MLANVVKDGARYGGRHAVCEPKLETTWSHLSHLAVDTQSRLQELKQQRVGVVVHSSAQSLANLAALDALHSDVFLIDSAHRSSTVLQELASRFHLNAIVDELSVKSLGTPNQSAESGVTILTSGTTGTPKAARHSWESLLRPVRRGDNTSESQIWLLAFRPHLYAGLQVILQCLINGGCLIMLGAEATPEAISKTVSRQRVQFASATPTYWRRLLLFGDRDALAATPLKQITLGGEATDQPLLNELSSIFPNARITHIYATTELGRCFSVSDGRAGFPTRFLDSASADGVELKIEDDQLLVRSANAMTGYDADSSSQNFDAAKWFATGDRVRSEGDRVYFVGRETDIINVGGNKVSPIEVENVLRSVDGVADIRVFGKASSIAGQLVACELVVQSGHEPAIVLDAVRVAARTLSRFQQPRDIQVVDAIEVSSAGKTIRSAQ